MKKINMTFKILFGIALSLTSVLFSASTLAVPAATPNTVLILGPTVSGGAGSIEATKASFLGFDVEIVDAATWGGITTAEFASYKAIIMGDPTCQTSPAALAAAVANTAVWGPAVTGNVIIIGSDPVFHGGQGGAALTENGIAFAAAEAGKTGAYITLSCYYFNQPILTPVPVLDAFSVGGFTVRGQFTLPALNDIKIVATHPAFTGLTDADLSNWGNSIHESFDSWPLEFEVLSIAKGQGGIFTAPDGTLGFPQIIARGVQVISDIDLDPDSATNPVGTSHTVTATVEEDGNPLVGVDVNFEIIDGPNTGAIGGDTTDVAGQAQFTWSSVVAGTDTIQATFVDSLGRTQRSDRVTKEWIGLPPIACDAGSDFSVNENTGFSLDGSASGGGSGELSFSWTEPLALDDPSSATPSGMTPVVDGNQDHTFTLTVTDDTGQSESCDVILTVIDSDLPPNCDNASASPAILWPPNHKMVEVAITGVVDTETGASISVTGVMQDEPTATALGVGDTSPDASLDGETARVRAERSGLEDGRVYEVTFTATDDLGQSCEGTVTLGVPHDKKDTPIDSGLDFNSLEEN